MSLPGQDSLEFVRVGVARGGRDLPDVEYWEQVDSRSNSWAIGAPMVQRVKKGNGRETEDHVSELRGHQ